MIFLHLLNFGSLVDNQDQLLVILVVVICHIYLHTPCIRSLSTNLHYFLKNAKKSLKINKRKTIRTSTVECSHWSGLDSILLSC